MQTEIRELTESKEKLTLELEVANETIVEQRNIIDQMTLELAESKKTINDKDQQSAMTEKDLKNEVRLLLRGVLRFSHGFTRRGMKNQGGMI